MRVIIKVKGHQYQWLAGGYDLEIGHFRSGYYGGYLVDSGFLCNVYYCCSSRSRCAGDQRKSLFSLAVSVVYMTKLNL